MAIELSDSLQDDHLEVNPFDDGATPGQYFADQVRQLSFNKLIHLAPYSELLLVSGDVGVGKSALLQQFTTQAADTWRAAMIQVRESDSDADLLLKIIEHLEMPLVTTDESRGILLDALARFLESLGRSGRRAIVILDDAQNLSDDQLAMLGGLLSDYRAANALSLILVAPPGFETRLQQVAELSNRLAYILTLEPLKPSEVASYINQRLGASGAFDKSGLFTDDVVKEIYHQSEGYPARINALARKVLETHKIDRVRRGSGGSGLGRGLVLVLGVTLVAGVFLFQDEINRFINTAEQTDMALLQTTARHPDKREAAPPAAEPHTVFEQPGGDDAPLTETRVAAPLPVVPAENQSDGNTALVAVPKIAAQQQIETPAPKEVEAVAPVEAEAAQPPAPAPLPAVGKVAAQAEVQPSRPELPADHKWLLAQPPGHYTLQLMALKDEATVRRFVERHKLERKSAVFFIERRGQRLAVLVYGSFATLKEAQQAAARLPKSWGVGNPWVRTFKAIRADYKPENQSKQSAP